MNNVVIVVKKPYGQLMIAVLRNIDTEEEYLVGSEQNHIFSSTFIDEVVKLSELLGCKVIFEKQLAYYEETTLDKIKE